MVNTAQGTSGASSGTDVVTGSSVIDQIMGYMQDLANYKLGLATLQKDMRGQDLSYLAQTGSTAASLQTALAGVAQQAEQARMAYDIDLKNYGLNVAQHNYNQRLGQLQGALATIGQGVDVVRQRTETGMANYQQRLGSVDTKLRVMDMLARRQGPQDFYQYTNLLNMLSPDAPGGGSTTVDPFQILNDNGGLVQPISDQLPNWANIDPSAYLQGLNQPITPQAGGVTPAPPGSYGGGASGSASGTAGGGLPPVTQVQMPGANGPDVMPNGQSGWGNTGTTRTTRTTVPGIAADGADVMPTETPRQQADRTARQFTPGGLGDYTASNDPGEVDLWRRRLQNANTTPYGPDPNAPTFTGFAAGGKAMPAGPNDSLIGPVQVGDHPLDVPTGAEEAVMVHNPAPDTVLEVQPMNPTGLAAQAGMLPPPEDGMLPRPQPQKEATSMPRMSPNHMETMAKAQKAIGSIEKALMRVKELLGADDDEEDDEMPKAAYGGTFTVGGQQTQAFDMSKFKRMRDRIRPNNGAPYTSPSPRGQDNSGGISTMPIRFNPLPPTNRPPEFLGGAYAPPKGISDMRVSPEKIPPSYAAPYVPPPVNSYESTNGSYDTRLARLDPRAAMSRAAGGGAFGPGVASTNVYGGAATTPTLTYSKYTPEQLGKMPFIQKLRGTMPSSQFSGFGAKLSNPLFGLEDMPSMVNMQTYRDYSPTDKDLLTSMYTQGLSTDFRDILERSQRATPYGTQWGPTGYR